MVKGVGDTAAYGDNIDKMSQKMGLSAQAYQEWDAIMQHSGTSIESLQAGMKTLANAVENGNGAFERLGITQEQIAEMNNEELFSATITALQNVENETERTYLAGQLLGRGATELGALLNTSAEDTEEMRRRVHELGGVMSDEAVKASAAYQDSLQDMQTAISGVSRGLTSKFLPSFTTIMDGITEIFSGDSEKGIGMVSQGLDDVLSTIEEAIPQMLERGKSLLDGLVTGISEHLPKIASVGMDILGRLGTAITENLPQLTDSAVQIIVMLSTGIISALPQIASSAVQIIVTLANGLAEQLPTLVPIAIDAIFQIVETLTDPDNLENLLDAAIAIILALADGLINSLPQLAARVPKIVQNIVDTIISNAPKLLDAAVQLIVKFGRFLVDEAKMLASKVDEIVTSIKDWFIEGVDKLREAGKHLLEGLWNGIADKVEWLKSKVSGVIESIKSLFTGSGGFDEHSPSKWSEGVADFIMRGMGLGFEKGEGSLLRTVDGIIGDVMGRFEEMNGTGFGLGNIEMGGIRTGSVDFQDSALGLTNAATINAMSNGGESSPTFQLTAQLVTPDGNVMAEWIANPLVQHMEANGTPIVNQKR